MILSGCASILWAWLPYKTDHENLYILHVLGLTRAELSGNNHLANPNMGRIFISIGELIMNEKRNQPSAQDYIIDQIKEISGQKNILIVPRIFITITGSINSAILLSQILYWSDKSTIGSFRKRLIFAKAKEEFGMELGLGRRAFENAQKKLEEFNLIITKEGGFAGKKCTFWQPNIEKIVSSVQEVTIKNQVNEINPDMIYEGLLDDFVTNDISNKQEKNPDELSRNEHINVDVIASEICTSESVCVDSKSENVYDKCFSNTETTSQITQETTTTRIQQDNGVAGAGFVNSKKEMLDIDLIETELFDFVTSINSNVSNEEAIKLIRKLESALAGQNRVSKDIMKMMISFSVVTGYSDFLKTDIKSGTTRTIIERWINPVQEWIEKKVTVEDIRTAMGGGIRDRIHRRLLCPASYSTRVLEANENQTIKNSHFDDEF